MNASKKKDLRFWDKWRFSGAVEPMVEANITCLLCGASGPKEKVPQSWQHAFCICKNCEKESNGK